MFRAIKLYFTDRPYYYQWKNYMKIQSGFRKKLKKLSKKFCPWSGYYMHEVVITMLEFYDKVYESGYCCWSEDQRRLRIAGQLKKALEYADNLEHLDDLELDEVIAIAEKDKTGFSKFIIKTEKKLMAPVDEKMLGFVAYDYLEDKYTRAIYDIIGKHIWGWSD